jgi:hypothetical protein
VVRPRVIETGGEHEGFILSPTARRADRGFMRRQPH